MMERSLWNSNTKRLLLLALLMISLCNGSMCYSVDSGNIQQDIFTDRTQKYLYNNPHYRAIFKQMLEQQMEKREAALKAFNSYQQKRFNFDNILDKQQQSEHNTHVPGKIGKLVIGIFSVIMSIIGYCIKLCCCLCCRKSNKSEDMISSVENPPSAFPMYNPSAIPLPPPPTVSS